MWIYDTLQSIKLFVILNPLETVVLLFFVGTWTGTYLESIFQFWDRSQYE